jgi:hypothetical protein
MDSLEATTLAQGHASRAEKHLIEVQLSGSNREANLGKIHALLAIYYQQVAIKSNPPRRI